MSLNIPTAHAEDSLTMRACARAETAMDKMARISKLVAQPVLRLALAMPFWYSGLTKWAGFLVLSPAATYLFSEEFKLHLPGGPYHLPFPNLLAPMDAVMELALPVLLVLGLGTRFAALGLLVMTGVIELVVPGGWYTYHLPWAAFALAIMALGAGPLSLDHLIARMVGRKSNP